MKAIGITEHGIISFYGNQVGYVKRDTAYVDPMFEKEELIGYLKEERSLQIKLQEGIYDKLISGEPQEEAELKRCRIYRMKPEVDARLKFIGLDELERRGFGKPDPKNYEVVFDGDIGTNDLERIYAIHQQGSGQSLFISDVVELYDDESSNFYYMDRFSFKEIEFNRSWEHPAQEKAEPLTTESNAEQGQGEKVQTVFTFTM